MEETQGQLEEGKPQLENTAQQYCYRKSKTQESLGPDTVDATKESDPESRSTNRSGN